MNSLLTFTDDKKDIKINILFKIEKEWEEKEEIKKIFSVVYQQDGRDVNFPLPTILHFHKKEIKENQKYDLVLSSYGKPRPDALITNDKLDTIGIEITQSFSSQSKRGSGLTREKENQKERLMKGEGKFIETDYGSSGYISGKVKGENDESNLFDWMVKEVEEKGEKDYKEVKFGKVKNIDNMVLWFILHMEFPLLVYRKDKERGFTRVKEWEVLREFYGIFYLERIIEKLDKIKIKKFKLLNFIVIDYFLSYKPLFCFSIEVIDGKIEKGIKSYFKELKKNFEKEWNCKYRDLITYHLSSNILATSCLSIKSKTTLNSQNNCLNPRIMP